MEACQISAFVLIGKMSLVPDYSSSSDEEEIAENEQHEEYDKPKLPSANILLSKEKTGKVFNNPYKEAEDAKIASLEKHVKMVETGEYTKEKNGKKICWNYRKGRCRFGSSCTFAHDSDLCTENTPDAAAASYQKDIPLTPTISKPQQGLQLGSSAKSDAKLAEKVNKRSRPGLGDSVVPSKKILKQYSLQKKKYP